MQKIDKVVARDILVSRQSANFHVDERLLQELEKEGNLYLLRLEDQECFLSLIWQESDPARLLTPRGQSRTLFDIAMRFIEKEYSFEKLNQELGFPRNKHQPEWFATCKSIDAHFDFAYFGWVVIVSPKDDERQQSPTGTFYIYDGVHKSLVLAKRLLTGESAFQPIEALFMVPRRE